MRFSEWCHFAVTLSDPLIYISSWLRKVLENVGETRFLPLTFLFDLATKRHCGEAAFS